MNLATTALLALSMSMDAFAASICKGATLSKPRFSEALRTGVIFGVIETITPLVGWLLGTVAAPYVSAWDHWIAFTLLCVLGIRMIRAGLSGEAPDAERPSRHGFWILAATAFGTSIDAMAVGVGLALIEVDIVWAAAAIGLATMVMVTIGVMLGRMLGKLVGRRAEIAGGLVLIGIGTVILTQHLNSPGG